MLTDTAIRNAKPGIKPGGAATAKPYKLADSGGLYLEVLPAGGRYWRWKYRYAGREKRLALGVYPQVSLREARGRRDEAKALLACGIDPSAHKKAARHERVSRAANTFEAVAREWYARHAPSWAPRHAERLLRRLERDVFPWLGARPVDKITAPDVLAVLRRIEARGALETAHRCLQNCGQVFRYAVATGRAERNPGADLRGALPPVKPVHFASLTEPPAVGDLLRAIEGYAGGPVVRAALRLAPRVFVRPGELRTMRWTDVDLDAAEWRFITSKTATAHIVPLSHQALAILREVEPLTRGGMYVFPSARGAARPMSENAITAALRSLGYDGERFTGHGFRAMARTLLDEALGVPAHLIEHQLAHVVRDPLGRAYNRTSHLHERRAMMQRWSDYLDELRAGQGGGAVQAAGMSRGKVPRSDVAACDQ